MKYEDDPGSIKYHVKQFLLENRERFSGKKVIDFPAGNGITSAIIRDIGAVPFPFDLFPEYFTQEGIQCVQADAENGLPVPDAFANAVICQEGMEHFNDQLKVLKEFNRVLAKEGTLLVTTPNYSNLRAKLSYLFSESERFLSFMPPNEKDSIWMKAENDTGRIYFGHIFLTGIIRLRLLAKLSGFRIEKVHATRNSSTCLFLFPFLYPWILLMNWLALKKNLRKARASGDPEKVKTYREVYKLAISPRILTDKHLMVEFRKEAEVREVADRLSGTNTSFGLT
ncbi:MAG: class I SAM-dependent methyltransferase [Bacteroidetes bacterium]|nr:class I SAM-dependent methyltransferase [Bacteroidota bacterium]